MVYINERQYDAGTKEEWGIPLGTTMIWFSECIVTYAVASIDWTI